MRHFRPEFDRRIDLPGIGPCPRPIDIDRAQTGFSRLVSLRVYSFAQGLVIDGEAEADEVFIVLMRGQADIAIFTGGHLDGTFSPRYEGGARAIYMPPHASYRLSAIADCDIAYARVQPSGTTFPDAQGFAPAAGTLNIIDYAEGMNLTLARLRAGDDEAFAKDCQLPERFAHVRSIDPIVATIAGGPLGDWDSLALDNGETGLFEVQIGTAEILVISASQQHGIPDR